MTCLEDLRKLPIMTEDGLRRVTVRGFNTKAHRGLVWEGGRFTIACSCPGSQNGSLRNRCRVICDGWEKSNCGN